MNAFAVAESGSESAKIVKRNGVGTCQFINLSDGPARLDQLAQARAIGLRRKIVAE
jgi:hypothetical protein